VFWEPDVALLPDHEPEALQLVAFVVDQLSVLVPPLLIDVGLAVNVSVGAGVGDGLGLGVGAGFDPSPDELTSLPPELHADNAPTSATTFKIAAKDRIQEDS